MLLRVLAFILLLFSILFMPFWLSVILALAGIIYFSFFVEAVLLFLLSDFLFGVPEAKFFNLVFVSFAMAAIILLSAEFLKKKLKFYP